MSSPSVELVDLISTTNNDSGEIGDETSIDLAAFDQIGWRERVSRWLGVEPPPTINESTETRAINDTPEVIDLTQPSVVNVSSKDSSTSYDSRSLPCLEDIFTCCSICLETVTYYDSTNIPCDSEYPLESWLMAPIDEATTGKTDTTLPGRSVVERCNVLYK